MNDRQRWGDPEPLYTGDALTNLHPEGGTRWVKDPTRGYWPDCCDLHRPESKRVGAAAADAQPKRKRAPGAVQRPLEADPAEPIDERTALRLLATWLKKLAREKS